MDPGLAAAHGVSHQISEQLHTRLKGASSSLPFPSLPSGVLAPFFLLLLFVNFLPAELWLSVSAWDGQAATHGRQKRLETPERGGKLQPGGDTARGSPS